MVKIATINILFELEEWQKRRALLVDGLAEVQADLIALQEAKLPEDTGAWIAEQLQMPYVYLVPKTEVKGNSPHSGIAILSRYPFERQEMLALQSQGRVAQYVHVMVEGQPFVFCNVLARAAQE